VQGKVPRVVGAPTSQTLKLLVATYFPWAIAGPSIMSLKHIFRILTEDSTALFAIPSIRISLNVSLTFPLLPSRCCCLRSRFLMSLLRFGCAQHLPCLIPDNRAPCSVLEWHDRPTVLGQGRPTARCRPPCRSFSAPVVSTATSSCRTF
jgi:hypothetical protein